MLDFMIQIIGEKDSGKTMLAKAIADALNKLGVEVKHCQHSKEDDYKDLSGKVVMISEFRAEKSEMEEF